MRVMDTDTGTYFGVGGKNMADRVDKMIDNARIAVGEKIEDGRIAAERMFKQSREAVGKAVEDGMTQTIRQVRRNPGRSLAVAFGMGAVVGAIAVRLTKRMIA